MQRTMCEIVRVVLVGFFVYRHLFMTNKVCTKCKETKDVSLFFKAVSNKSGYGSWCKECKSFANKEYNRLNKEKVYARTKAYSKDRPEMRRKAWLKFTYEMSVDQYDHLRKLQDYKCAICGLHESENLKEKLYIDHDHSTSKVRGLLCHFCNSALGKFKDDPALLRRAAQYLEMTTSKADAGNIVGSSTTSAASRC